MSNAGAKADLSVRIVQTVAQADESVFVVNQQVVTGAPTTGEVPVVQADGTLAWAVASSGAADLTVIRRNSLAMTAAGG